MAEWFASGRLVDLILVLVAVEAAALVLYSRLTARGVTPADLLPNLFSGVFLLLSLRLTLAGASWQLCCGSLAAAGFAHLVDLGRRWRK